MLPLLYAVLSVSIGPMGPEAPAREPQMAAAGSTVALAFGAGKSIYVSLSHDSGATFSTPIKVAEAGILPLTRHRGPRIVLSGRTIVVTAVGGSKAADGPHAHGLPSDGDLWAWRSADEGRTWSKAVRINDVPGAATEGLHSLAVDTKGALFAVWLDKRGEGTTLFAARSTDGGRTWAKNTLVYESPEGSICQCCHPSAVFTPDGEVLVMWRNWLDGSRDMYLARSRDGLKFGKPEKLGSGTWKLNACPMDGGGVAVARGKVITAWRREGDLYLSSPGEPELRLAKGTDVAIAGAESGVYTVWTGADGVRAALPGRPEPLSLAPKGAFPSVVTLPGSRALVAWEADGAIELRRLP